jgi:uncharacterized protein YeaO (DUF488 family)
LKTKAKLIELVNQLHKEKGAITLLYAAKDRAYNNAIALIEMFKS